MRNSLNVRKFSPKNVSCMTKRLANVSHLDFHLGSVWNLVLGKEKNTKKNDFLMFGFS